MTPEELKKLVDDIIASAGDPEASHGLEDEMYEELALAFSPAWVHSELDRLKDVHLIRWYA